MRILLLTLCLILLSLISLAENTREISLSKWSELPIAHEGRIKPIDSFARIILKKISGHESIDKLSAKKWLAEVVFDPSSAMNRDIFKVKQPQVLNLHEQKNNFYSYIEISTAIDENKEIISKLLEIDEKNWSPEQREMMRVFQNHILMTQALRSLTSILPLPFETPKSLNTLSNNFTNYLYLKAIEEKITASVKKTINKKGTNPKNYNKQELQVVDISFQLQIIEEGGKNNVLFKISPENWGISHTEWISPWGIILNGKGSPQSAKYLEKWQKMAISYQNNDTKTFNSAISNAKIIIANKNTTSIKIEKIFNIIPLKNMVTTIYFIIFLSLFIYFFFNISSIKLSRLFILSFSTGVFLHTIHIGLRIFILDRPPVGTLYESILFVSFICALTMLLIALKQKQDKQLTSLFIGSLSAFSLLFISNGLVDANRMPTLVAVLNTNFWLTTHVLCITIGYSFCLLAGIMAHIYLFKTGKKDEGKSYFKMIVTTAIFALLFTCVGTILGGIWADQSWGRFWGWDPKENGALLIVLWLIWLLHSRISGHLGKFGFAIGMALINIVVIIAWFGVNLLNVGLHSYGFIDGIALSIGVFCTIEITLITALAIKASRAESTTP